MAIGNSIVNGEKSGDPGSSIVWESEGWVPQMRDYFADRFGDTGYGIIVNNNPDRVVKVGTSAPGLGAAGFVRNQVRLGSASQKITYSLPPCTDIAIYSYWTSASGNNPYTWSLDGGAQTGVQSTPPGSDVFATDWIHGLTNTTHTLVLTGPSTKVADISGVGAYTNINTGVVVHRLGASGGYITNAFLADPGDSPSSASLLYRQYFQLVPTDLLLLCFGANEVGAGQALGHTPTNYASRVSSVIDVAKSYNVDVLVVNGPRRDPASIGATYPEEAYYDAVNIAVRDGGHAAIFDIKRYWGAFTSAYDPVTNPDARMYDTVHPTTQGQCEMGRTIFEAIGAI